MSRSLSLKVDVLPQQCHKSKTFSFQFQEQDASSTKSTDQSYPEVGMAQSDIWIETLPFCITLNVNFERCPLREIRVLFHIVYEIIDM